MAERGEYVLSNAAVELHGASEAASDVPPAPRFVCVFVLCSAHVSLLFVCMLSVYVLCLCCSVPFAADAVFAELKKRVTKDLVSKVHTPTHNTQTNKTKTQQINAVYRFDISKGDVKRSFVVDAKNGDGKVGESNATAQADCVIGLFFVLFGCLFCVWLTTVVCIFV